MCPLGLHLPLPRQMLLQLAAAAVAAKLSSEPASVFVSFDDAAFGNHTELERAPHRNHFGFARSVQEMIEAAASVRATANDTGRR